MPTLHELAMRLKIKFSANSLLTLSPSYLILTPWLKFSLMPSRLVMRSQSEKLNQRLLRKRSIEFVSPSVLWLTERQFFSSQSLTCVKSTLCISTPYNGSNVFSHYLSRTQSKLKTSHRGSSFWMITRLSHCIRISVVVCLNVTNSCSLYYFAPRFFLVTIKSTTKSSATY